MLVVAASALTMAIIAGTVGHKITPKKRTSGARVPVMNPPAVPIASQLPDPFVIVADATIDLKMVVPAPPLMWRCSLILSPGTGCRRWLLDRNQLRARWLASAVFRCRIRDKTRVTGTNTC